ncbi:MAG: hypothetical protein ACI8Z1_001057 [Candidatus Azotimanducaceae bacterium]|jgi:hypothetical protein
MSPVSLSRILITCAFALLLTACGGGGGGGGNIITGDDTAGGDGGDGGSAGTGTLVLSISGLVDASGAEDSVLSGNEFATLSAVVEENGSAANVVVLFQTTIGRLVPGSAQSTGGTATVQVTGDGTPGAATVTATATLSGGATVTDEIVVQMSSEAPTLKLLNASGAEATTVELRAAETSAITAEVRDWDGTPVSGVGVNFALNFNGNTSLSSSVTSGATDANGQLPVVITGTQEAGTGTFTATAVFSEFDLEDSFPANGLGVNTDQNNLSIDAIEVGTDGVLAGNEKTMVVVRVLEDGVAKNGIVVQFSTNESGGTLVQSSATTANDGTNDGVAMVQIIGDATPGTATITAMATLSNSITVSDTEIVQTSESGPTLSIELRDAAGLVVDTFGANQILTLEATIIDHDGTALDADDAGVNVMFDAGGLGSLNNASDVTEFAVCPANGIKQNADCAFVEFTSNSTGAVGTLAGQGILNNITLMDDIQVTNTGINSGAGDQDSFSISRVDNNGRTIAIDDIFGIEGDQFNDQTAVVEVDLADFFNNPVPDGTLIKFRTELGDIGQSCQTLGGSCDVTFTSADPRAPIDTEVSFRNLTDDKCPSRLVVNETSAVSSGKALTDYRVERIRRVVRTGTAILLTEGATFNATANGIECIGTCGGATSVDITYDRLWLDELDDGTTAHVLANPGEATEPFLAVTGTPCLAQTRNKLELITGTINPSGSTSVGGVGTIFDLELAAGDRLKVNDEIRTITAIGSNTSLTVDTAFSDGVNDVSPQRVAAPAYLGGLGQPYGGRSSILAFALGEESFVDVNGNDEYDFGETFFDLPEVFMDKNTDGVLGDVNGDSAALTTIGPYTDAGSGTNPGGGKTDKSSPFCYGPKTIVGDPAGSGSSTEKDTYCYQDGGEEEFFIDADGDNEMDLGNTIYNGSRCLTPLQDADGDGNADDVVCTTDLVNISRDVEILMAGSGARIAFRTNSGGANGNGELISSVEPAGGLTIADTIPIVDDWTVDEATAVIDITVQKGADVNTALLGGGSRDVELFTIPGAITQAGATWTLSFTVTRTDVNTGAVEVFAAGQQLTFDGGVCGDTTETCTATNFTVTGTGDLIIASDAATDPLGAEINDFTLTGTTSGLGRDYRLVNGEITSNTGTTLTSIDTDANPEEFAAGDTANATTVIGGVSERLDDNGIVPTLSTSLRNINVHIRDRYNGQMPDGTTVRVESDNSQGCTLTSVAGIVVNSNDAGADSGGTHFGSVTIGSQVSTVVPITLSSGFSTGSVIVTATAPSGTITVRGFSCSI